MLELHDCYPNVTGINMQLLGEDECEGVFSGLGGNGGTRRGVRNVDGVSICSAMSTMVELACAKHGGSKIQVPRVNSRRSELDATLLEESGGPQRTVDGGISQEDAKSACAVAVFGDMAWRACRTFESRSYLSA